MEDRTVLLLKAEIQVVVNDAQVSVHVVDSMKPENTTVYPCPTVEFAVRLRDELLTSYQEIWRNLQTEVDALAAAISLEQSK